MNSVMIGSIAGALYYLNKKKEQKEPPKRQYPVYHSILLWFFFGWIVLWLPCIYYFLSDKHKFKLL